MANSKAAMRRHGEAPFWDEDPNTFEDFIYESFMFRDELAFKNKAMAVARLMRGFKERRGAAWRLCKSLREKPIGQKTLQGPHGVEYLLQQLKKELCPQAVPDIAKHIDNYLYKFRRESGEVMNGYVTRDAEVYSRMCQALARVGADPSADMLEATDWALKTYQHYKTARQDQAKWKAQNWQWHWNAYQSWGENRGRQQPWSGTPSRQQPESGTAWRASSAEGVDNMSFDDVVDFDEQTPERGGDLADLAEAMEAEHRSESAGEWTGDYLEDPWWNEGIEPWQQRGTSSPLPDVLLGWLLLHRSGLERSEKLALQSSVSNTWSRAAVAQALKDQWPDAELQRRDAHRGERRGRDGPGKTRAARMACGVFDIHSDSEYSDLDEMSRPTCAATLEQAFSTIVGSEEVVLEELEPHFSFADGEEEEAYFNAVDSILELHRDARGLQRKHAEARGIINDIKRNRGYFRDRNPGGSASSASGLRPTIPGASPFLRWQQHSGGAPASSLSFPAAKSDGAA